MSTKGRALLTRAAEMTDIGKSVEDIDDANGGEIIRVTLVRSTTTRSFTVHQGVNNRPGQQMYSVFSKEELKEKDGKRMVSRGLPSSVSGMRPF